MKKILSLLLAAVLVCAAVAASAQASRGDPMEVSKMLSQRLESMNLNPQPLENKENLALKGDRYVLSFSGGELQLFAYRDGDAAAKDLQTVSADGRQLGELTINWAQSPHFFLRDNVIVLYLGENAPVLDMLERLCGPQIRGG